MGSFLLKYEDEALWRRVKAKAAMQDVTVGDVIKQLLKDWAAPEKKRRHDHDKRGAAVRQT